jgi:hypothetical protein
MRTGSWAVDGAQPPRRGAAAHLGRGGGSRDLCPLSPSGRLGCLEPQVRCLEEPKDGSIVTIFSRDLSFRCQQPSNWTAKARFHRSNPREVGSDRGMRATRTCVEDDTEMTGSLVLG